MTGAGAAISRGTIPAAASERLVAASDRRDGEPVRVLFCCTGVGILGRGIETFFREAFDGLAGMEDVDARLLKGAGVRAENEEVVWTLPRTGRLAPLIGRLARRNAYVAEQWTSFFPVALRIRRFRPHVIFYSDANLGFLLYWFRNQIGVPYRLLFSNGGPCHPPFVRTDFVHQVAPHYYEEALSAGEPAKRHFMVPYGIGVPPCQSHRGGAERAALRRRLGLPADRPIVLSVGWIARPHKRMDYVVDEIAQLPEPRPFLVMLGAMDRNSAEILARASQALGEGNFVARSVPPGDVADYYQAADIFALASLQEGFGRVFLEAMMHGLPVIAHRHPVMEYVIGDAGTLADLSRPTGLAREIALQISRPDTAAAQRARFLHAAGRFGWDALREDYRQMFVTCANGTTGLGQPT